MSTIQAGFGQTLTRASVLPLCLFTAAAAYLVPSQLFADRVAPAPEPAAPVIWKADYSERYPGCVASILWPSAERPVALVMLADDGTTARVSQQEARQRMALGERTIGACRLVD